MEKYTAQEVSKQLGVNIRTLGHWKNVAKITPKKGKFGANLYDDKDIEIFQDLKKHLDNGGEYSNFELLDISPVEIVTSENVLPVRRLNSKVDLVEDFKDWMREGYRNDMLFDLRLLEEIADKLWLVETKRLSIILGVSPAYLNQRKKIYYRGFVCSREYKEGKSYTWKVESNNS